MEAGTTDNVVASVTGGSTEPTSSGVSSGTASEAMIKAATAASSAETSTEGAASVLKPAEAAGDTTQHGPAKAGVVAAPDTTVQDAAKGTPDATGKPTHVPLDRHESAVRNARTASEKAVRAEYGNIAPAKLKAAFTLASRVAKDPEAFYEELGKSLGKTGTPKQAVDLHPRLQSEDGQTAYTSDQVQHLLTEAKKELMGQLKPMMDFFATESDTRAAGAARAAAKETASAALTEARALPYFKENEEAIKTQLLNMDPEVRSTLGPIGAMYRAYTLVLGGTVLPGVDKQAEERVKANFAKKAASGAGSVHPSGTTGGDGAKPVLNNVDQLAKHMAAMAVASA